jgi:FkbM family methyltransferase
MPGEVFYDVGANVGSYSLLALNRGLEVIAFEPHYENFRELCRNVELNKLGARAALVPLALSDQSGAVRNPVLAPSAGETMSLGAGENGPIIILTSKLDDARRILQLPDPNHVKIDVDGWEVRVLAGASQTFGLEQLRTCLIEIDERAQGPDADRNSAVWSFLAKRGFEIYAIACPMTQDVTYLLGIRGNTAAVKSSLERRGISLVRCNFPVGH